MGAKRRAAAGSDFVFVEVDSSSKTAGLNIPDVDAGVIAVQIGTRGELTPERCRNMADVVSRAVDRQPDALVIALVGGFEDDPREVLDIPEARAAFRCFGERLRELDQASGQPRLLNRLESVTRGLIHVAMGILPAENLELVPIDAPVLVTQAQADRDRLDAMQRRFRADTAEEASRNRKQ